MSYVKKIEDVFYAIKYGEHEESIQNYRDILSKDEKKAEEKLKALGYSWKWLKDKSLLATSPALPAISILPDGSKSFFNQSWLYWC